MKTPERIKYIKDWIIEYCKSMPREADSLIVGISGGIDSSVTSALCALTGKKTIVLSMPLNQIKEQHDLSLKHQYWLKSKFKNVESHLINLDSLFKSFKISLNDFNNEHGLANSQEEIRDSLFIHRAQDPYPFEDNEFDLVISLGCFHNLRIFEMRTALSETERVGKQGYVMLESYRNELEQFNLQCWALTCESFFDHEEWPWIYKHFGYTGDYEFIYFE